jgi:hypothetical protein
MLTALDGLFAEHAVEGELAITYDVHLFVGRLTRPID